MTLFAESSCKDGWEAVQGRKANVEEANVIKTVVSCRMRMRIRTGKLEGSAITVEDYTPVE